MEWTDEIISRLQTLWQEGLSTAEIGRQLSITKNAVVGKAHRLGLPPRPSPIRAAAKARKDAPAELQASVSATQDDVSSVAAPSPAPESQAVAAGKPAATSAVSAAAAPEPVAGTAASGATRPDPAPAASAPIKPEPAARPAAAARATADTELDSPVSGKTVPPRKPAEAKTMAPDLMLRPLLRPLTADTAPRRGPSCCWPNGDPGTPGFHFCGAKPVPGKPYCAEHCAVAYVKLRDRRESVG